MLDGRYVEQQRTMLEVAVERPDGRSERGLALNDVVVNRGSLGSMIECAVDIDGRFAYALHADGIIVATPTGSTAYALAAGGPVLPPELRNILVVPVAPHLSLGRAIVLPDSARVTIQVDCNHHQAVISGDGHAPIEVADGDRIEIWASAFSARFVRFRDPGYFFRRLTRYMEQNPAAGEIE